MVYIPILTYNSETEAAFQIHIISEREEKEIGIASAIFAKKDKIKMVQCEYYVPESHFIFEKEIERACVKFLDAMKEIEKMVV